MEAPQLVKSKHLFTQGEVESCSKNGEQKDFSHARLLSAQKAVEMLNYTGFLFIDVILFPSFLSLLSTI